MAAFKHIEIIPYLIHCLEKEKNLRLFSFSSVLGIGIFILFFFGSQHTALIIISMMLIITSIKFLRDTINAGKPKYDPLIQTLSFHPEKVVWFYTLKIDNMPFGIQLFSHGRLIFKLVDGSELSLSIPCKDIIPITSILRDMLPHATFGFSSENQQFFDIDPLLLQKD